MGTISRIGREVNTNQENNSGGRPAKLAAYDKQSILCQITSGKLDNAVQATNFINTTLSQPVHSQTVRNALKEAGLHSATKKKVPMLKLTSLSIGTKFAQNHENWTVEDCVRTGTCVHAYEHVYHFVNLKVLECVCVCISMRITFLICKRVAVTELLLVQVNL